MMKVKLIVLAFLFWEQVAHSENLAIMAFIENSGEGDRFYDSQLKKFSFKRPPALTNDYHVTLGYVKDVAAEDVEDFKNHFRDFLKNSIDFKIDEVGLLLRRPSRYLFKSVDSPETKDNDFLQENQFVVSVSYANNDFKQLNQKIYEELLTYRNGKYKLDDLVLPENFVPHMTLGMVNELLPDQVSNVLKNLNDSLKGLSFRLTRIVIN